MAITQREEARALSADERELVEKSHHPALQNLPDQELAQLVRLVRERREKAQTHASRQRREMRGKVQPKGASPSTGDAGSRLKVTVLATAMRRLNNEATRRRRMAGKASLQANAQKALAMKSAAEPQEPAFNSRHAHEGMQKIANQRREDLIRPMELGRQRQAAKVAQAKRDAR